jgi:hypothetical protein
MSLRHDQCQNVRFPRNHAQKGSDRKSQRTLITLAITADVNVRRVSGMAVLRLSVLKCEGYRAPEAYDILQSRKPRLPAVRYGESGFRKV